MDLQTTKLDLIHWLTQINDIKILQAIQSLRKQKVVVKKRQFGSGKHLIGKIADDFNEPLDAFEDYLK